MSTKFIKLSFLLVGIIFLTSACSWSWPWAKKDSPAPARQTVSPEVSPAAPVVYTNGLKKFNGLEELASFLADNNNSEGELSSEIKIQKAALSGSLAPLLAPTELSAQENYLDYTTNLPSGAQRADLIKTNGNYTYALAKDELIITKTAPASSASIISRIVFKSRPTGLFLVGNVIAIFGNDNQIADQNFYQSFRRQNPYTFFKVFDVTDPTNPQLLRDLSFEGIYQEARLVGDYVYFLTSTQSNYIAGETLTPRLVESGQVLPEKCSGVAKCFVPEVYYFDIAYTAYRFANIAMINITNNSEPLSGQAFLLDRGQNIYISSDNIYISYAPNIEEYDLERQAARAVVYSKLSASDQEKITKIEATLGFVLNNREKKIKVAQIINSYLESLTADDRAPLDLAVEADFGGRLSEQLKSVDKLSLYKFALNNNKLEYRAKGEISGHLLNQFSLDEDGEYLRVATLNSSYSAALSTATDFYSSIYILDKDLKTVGSLENLATTEKIINVRFIGNRAYLVAAKTTSPLFVINMADPTKPTVSGALKINGLANYLYPADASGNKLISLGYELEGQASSSQKIKGLKLTLFDFSDLAKPKELDSFLIGDAASGSLTFGDHQAFAYSLDKNLLSFPTTLHDSKGRLSFAGSLVFSSEADHLQLKGRVDHSAGGHFGQLDSWAGLDYYDNAVKRVLYFNDNFISFSNKFLKISSLAKLDETKSLELTARGNDYLIETPAAPTSTPTIPEDTAGAVLPPPPGDDPALVATSSQP